MGSQSASLSDQDKAFISEQKIFFIASSSNKEVNLSPRGYDCFRVIGDNEAVFLDYTGSGNRTARDIQNDGEVTVMFCSFDSTPMILRLFCKGEIINKENTDLQAIFNSLDLKGMRQFIKLTIYCVEHSCGMSVPQYELISERNELKEWCQDKDRNGSLNEYIENHHVPVDLNYFKSTIKKIISII